MSVAAAQLVVSAFALYLLGGVVFAVLFLWRWVGGLDPAAKHATWGFRVLVFPGVVALWPAFVVRLVKGAHAPPEEWTAHRTANSRDARGKGIEVLR